MEWKCKDRNKTKNKKKPFFRYKVHRHTCFSHWTVTNKRKINYPSFPYFNTKTWPTCQRWKHFNEENLKWVPTKSIASEIRYQHKTIKKKKSDWSSFFIHKKRLKQQQNSHYSNTLYQIKTIQIYQIKTIQIKMSYDICTTILRKKFKQLLLFLYWTRIIERK